jgi:excisionase family DNA binding protein
MADSQLLTIKDFVSQYRISRSATYRLLASGELKAVKVGRRTMIERQCAARWLANLPPLPQSRPYDQDSAAKRATQRRSAKA